jgi:SAM-dependent methyltransferase
VRLRVEDRSEERAVALTGAAVRSRETSRAFDAVAEHYHRTNVANPLLSHMRGRTMAILRRSVPAGASLIDLGCGPGTDHPAMIAAGYRVTGVDSSPEMVRCAQQAASALPGERVEIRYGSLDDLSAFAPASFDAAFSNFGPLNCVADLGQAARRIYRVLRPGGVFVGSIIGRYCPWEVGLFLARGEASRAFIRWRRGQLAVPLDGRTVWTRYYSVGECAATFERVGFTRLYVATMGLAAPPPYAEAFAGRHPRVVSMLLAVDHVVGTWPVLRSLGDHFVIVLKRG